MSSIVRKSSAFVRVSRGSGRYYLILLAILWAQPLYEHLRGFFTHIPVIGLHVASYIMPAIILFFALKCVSSLRHFINIWDIAFYIIVGIVYMFNYIDFPENSAVLDIYASGFFLTVLPFYFAGVVFELNDESERVMYYVSISALIILAAYYLLYVQSGSYSGKTEIRTDMMGASYAALPFFLFILRKLFLKFNVLDLGISIAGFVFLLSLGTKGPIVCILVFIAGYMLFMNELSKTRISLFLIVLLLIYNIDVIFEWLSNFLGKTGMSIRVVEYFMLGEGMSDDASTVARLTMGEQLLSEVTATGNGVGSFVTKAGVYSHNIIYDMLFEYGFILGSVMLIVIFGLFGAGWKRSHTVSNKSFVLLLFCISIIHLMVSHTYLILPEFFFAIGYCVHVIRNSKSPKLFLR